MAATSSSSGSISLVKHTWLNMAVNPIIFNRLDNEIDYETKPPMGSGTIKANDGATINGPAEVFLSSSRGGYPFTQFDAHENYEYTIELTSKKIG